MKKYNIGVLVGSLRKESYNLKVAKTLMEIAPESLSLELLKIDDLPMYNEDSDANPPAQYKTFREKIKRCDGVLFVTPEYNRSVPAVLKNAIDVGSRPYGKNSWDGKPGAVVSVTISSLGGFGANHHLRQSLVFINVPVMAQPEAYLSSVKDLFNEKGELIDDSTKEFLTSFMSSFERWVTVHAEMEISV